MAPSPRVLLAGCAGVLLLAGAVAGITVAAQSDKPKASNTSADGLPSTTVASVPDTTTSVSAAPETTTSVAPGSTSPSVTTGTGNATSTTLKATGATTTLATIRPGGPAPSSLLAAPKPGTYSYEATSTSSGQTRTTPATTIVESVGNEGGSPVQAITLPLDFQGQQAVARNTVIWDAAGATVRRSVITAFGQQIDCVWQPPFLQYAGGLAVGKTWMFTTRCVGKVLGADVTLEQRATRRVTGTAQVPGPNGTIPTWTVADDTTLSLTAAALGGTSTVRTVGTQQLAPGLGLPVRTEATVTVQSPGVAATTTTTTTRLVAQP